ncbi:hypothetical protein BKA64DRAFT_387263 [Cadophora sp. MPI-SDFR-AT-0126]|nr:hypothetical protein BKA64DRAFT_387263 [Leotiomycetes sp. MPI-SDFR-AT-0126]
MGGWLFCVPKTKLIPLMLLLLTGFQRSSRVLYSIMSGMTTVRFNMALKTIPPQLPSHIRQPSFYKPGSQPVITFHDLSVFPRLHLQRQIPWYRKFYDKGALSDSRTPFATLTISDLILAVTIPSLSPTLKVFSPQNPHFNLPLVPLLRKKN